MTTPDLDLLDDEELEAGDPTDEYGQGLLRTEPAEDIVPTMIAQRDARAAFINAQASRWAPPVTRVTPDWASTEGDPE